MSHRFWLNIPNMLTMGRILAVPYMVWLVLSDKMDVAFWVFIIAGISDGLDGYIAKTMNASTRIGAFLDPIADKLLLVSAFVVLGLQGLLPLWLVIMVVFRDVAIVIGAGLIELFTHKLEMAPNFSSKVNTTVQIMLAATVLGVSGLEINDMDQVVTGLIITTAGTTILSGVVYLYQWGAIINQTNGDM